MTVKSSNRARKRICMIVYTDYAFDARVRREAETLADAGFEVICLTPRNGSRKQEYQLRGVVVRELPVSKYRGKSHFRYLNSYVGFLLRSFAACNGLLIRGGLDAVHVHNVPDFLVAAGIVPRLLGKTVLLDIHDSVPETYAAKFPDSSRLLRRLLCWEEKISAGLASQVICVNHPQRDRLLGRGLASSKAFVSMNVPDHRLFENVVRESRHDDGAFKLVYHGTMAKRLGVDLILRSVAKLAGKIPGLELHLWGHGDDLQGFQTLGKELGLEGIVHFLPKGFPVHELPQRLIHMDVGLVGNRRDEATELMLPVKLLEYVALGIPVVAPRLKTIEHYFSNEMVSYYEPEDVEMLSTKILELHTDKDRRKQQADRARAFLDQYGWQKQGGEFVALYRSLMEGGTRK